MELNSDQRDDIRNFLLSRGLAFKPLLDEMSDHIACDLENLVRGGMSYEDAWKQTINTIPENHFKQIQQETMETINQRFALSRVFTYVALAAMVVATIFKILHLNGADEALITSFAAIAASLITASVSGIYYNRDKKGTLRVASVVASVVVMILGYTFKFLHLPGADQVIIFSGILLIVALITNTQYVYNRASGTGNLFTFLHEKYSPGIERFLLILTVFVILFGALKLFGNTEQRFFIVINVVAIYGAGLQMMSLAWRRMEQDLSTRNAINAIMIVLAFTCFCLPMLGSIVAFKARLVSILLFNVLGSVLAFRMDPKNYEASIIAFATAGLFSIGTLSKLFIGPIAASDLPMTIIIACVIITGVIVSKKDTLTRMFLILSLAGVFIETSN